MRGLWIKLLFFSFYVLIGSESVAVSRENLEGREPFTQKFFSELIGESHAANTPFLVLQVVSTQEILYLPETFLHYVQDMRTGFIDPLTRQPIVRMSIYQIPVGTQKAEFSYTETNNFLETLLGYIQAKKESQVLPKDIEIIRYIIRTSDQYPMARGRACMLSAQIYRDGRGGVARNGYAAKIYAERARQYCVQAGLEHPETVDFWVLIMAEKISRELNGFLVGGDESRK